MPHRVHLDFDQDRMTWNGAEYRVDETAMAACLLASLGHDRHSISAHAGPDAEAAIALLAEAGWSEGDEIELTADGFSGEAVDTPLAERHLCGWLKGRADEAPTDIALIVEDPEEPIAEAIHVTALDLYRLASEVSSRLAGEQLGPGNRIAVSADPSLESILLCLAAWEAGVSVVLVREAASLKTLSAIATHLAPAIWFTHRVPNSSKRTRHVPIGTGHNEAFETWLTVGPTSKVTCPPNPEREAVVVTSSGSTGTPKLVSLSHRALFSNAGRVRAIEPKHPAARNASITDLSAMSGLRTLAVFPALGYATTILLSNTSRQSGLDALFALGRLGATHVQAIPATIATAAQLDRSRFAEFGLKSLQMVSCGTGVLHRTLKDAFESRFDGLVYDNYGLNEAGGSFAWSREGTMGNGGGVAQNCLVRIVTPEHTPCRTGQSGLIRIFGEGLYAGIYGENGFEAREAGWFTTGDLGRRNPDGTLEILGRVHGMIKTVEGEFLSSVAVEEAVLVDSGILEAVALPIAATTRSERYALALCPVSGNTISEPSVNRLITEALGPYAAPSKIMIFNDFPRAANGKPDRAKLMDLLSDDA